MLLTIVPSFLELLLSCSGTFDYSVAPMGCIPPGSSVHGILQTRILEWVFPSPEDLPNPGIKSRYPTLQVDSLPSEPPGKLSRVQLFATPRTVAYQAPLSMGFSRQESWSGLPFPSPGDLPNPGIKLGSPALQTDALPSEPPGKSSFNL